MHRGAKALGIDFGTKHFSVAAIIDDVVSVIELDKGKVSVPIFLSSTGIKFAKVGSEGIYDLRRLVGRSVQHFEVQHFNSQWGFNLLETEGLLTITSKDISGFNKEIVSIDTHRALANIFLYLRHKAEEQTSSVFNNVTISVPAHFNWYQQQVVHEAAEFAGWTSIKLVHEPVAAAIAYYTKCPSKESELVLVFHLGSSTLDLSLLTCGPDKIQLNATGGDQLFGGNDFTNCLVHYCVEEFERQHGYKNVTPTTIKSQALVQECENAKINIPFREKCQIFVKAFHSHDLDIEVDREVFDRAAPMDKINASLNRFFQDEALDQNAINKVILVGGSTKNPLVRECLRDYFPTSTLCIDYMDVQSVICTGAALKNSSCPFEVSEIMQNVDKSITLTKRQIGTKLKSSIVLEANYKLIDKYQLEGNTFVLFRKNQLLPAEYNISHDDCANLAIDGHLKLSYGKSNNSKFNSALASISVPEEMRTKIKFAIDAGGELRVAMANLTKIVKTPKEIVSDCVVRFPTDLDCLCATENIKILIRYNLLEPDKWTTMAKCEPVLQACVSESEGNICSMGISESKEATVDGRDEELGNMNFSDVKHSGSVTQVKVSETITISNNDMPSKDSQEPQTSSQDSRCPSFGSTSEAAITGLSVGWADKTALILTTPTVSVNPTLARLDAGPVIGIDFGTTYSCMCVHQNKVTQAIPSDSLTKSATTPNYVSYHPGGEIVVGELAQDEALQYPKTTFFHMKRMLGRSCDYQQLQTYRNIYPFEITTKNDQFRVMSEEAAIAPETLITRILQKLREDATEFLGRTVTDAVASIPSHFSLTQVTLMREAFIAAGFNVLKFVTEPTAAALSYGILHEHDFPQFSLVFDLGGGTFDVAILESRKGVIRILAIDGHPFIGGEDFDTALMDYCLETFLRETGKNLRTAPECPLIMTNIRRACERAKGKLTLRGTTNVFVPNIHDGRNLNIEITRERFNSLIQPRLDECMRIVDRILRAVGKKHEDMHKLVLVGGASRIPRVSEMLVQKFEGRLRAELYSPEQAVARGAAILGAIIQSNESNLLLIEEMGKLVLTE